MRLMRKQQRLLGLHALKAKTVDPFVPAPPSSSSAAPTVTASYTPSVPQNRAEKYLPNLPVIDHQGMSKGRMREVECWHSFLETLSSWLALQDEAYVRELQFCVKTKHEIDQASLAANVAARSAKLFYYLTQSLAKWEKGLELLRSCSKRQSQSATGYEVVRTINAQYSIVSRMEAVVVREHCLKLHQECKNIRQPTGVIRHLEDEFSRAESKLTNFTELKQCSVLLQALGPEVRQYVLLHGSSSDWKDLTKSLTYYEEQGKGNDPRQHRHTWAAVAFKVQANQIEVVATAAGSLGGRQTVYRSEAAALCFVCQHTKGHVDVTLDCKALCNRVARGKLPVQSADLLEVILAAESRLDLHWINSHLTEEKFIKKFGQEALWRHAASSAVDSLAQEKAESRRSQAWTLDLKRRDTAVTKVNSLLQARMEAMLQYDKAKGKWLPPKVDKGHAGDSANASELQRWQQDQQLGHNCQLTWTLLRRRTAARTLHSGGSTQNGAAKRPRHEAKPKPEEEVEVKEELQKEERRNKPPRRPKRSKKPTRAGSSGDRPPPPPPPADPASSSEEESEEEEAEGDPILFQEGPGVIQVGPKADMCVMANVAGQPVGLSGIVEQLPTQPGQFLKFLPDHLAGWWQPGLYGGLTKKSRGYACLNSPTHPARCSWKTFTTLLKHCCADAEQVLRKVNRQQTVEENIARLPEDLPRPQHYGKMLELQDVVEKQGSGYKLSL
ncbi:GIP, partial [Symbiodinium microadriaticum]